VPSTWRIYLVEKCRHTRPVPKDKLVVIVCRDEDLTSLGFLINSGIHRYIRNRPHLLACQALIEASQHRCLNLDSYVDCADLYGFEDAELVDERDLVSTNAKAEIKRAVMNSVTITRHDKKLILSSC